MIGMIGWMKPAHCDMKDVLNVKLLSELIPELSIYHVALELTKLGMSEHMAFRMRKTQLYYGVPVPLYE